MQWPRLRLRSPRPVTFGIQRIVMVLAATFSVVGATLLASSIGGLAPGASAATALTGPYELYCPGSPIGTIALDDVQTSAAITPASPSSGQTFNVTGYQTTVTLPSSLATAAAAISPTLTGSASEQVDVAGATPATMSAGMLSFSVTFPSPIPSSGVPLSVPSTPESVGPFTATSSDITVQEDSSATLSLTVQGTPIALTCTAYPNDATPNAGGIASGTPSGSPIAPVIAVAGTPTTTTTSQPGSTTTTTPAGSSTTTTAPTGSSTTTTPTGSTTTTTQPVSGAVPYELYCPGSPIGTVALNDVETTAAVTPASPSSGQTFNVTGYQTSVTLPAALASAASAISPTLTGTASAQLDVTGATPATMSTGTLSFSVTFPSPIPSSGVPLSVPSSPTTVGPFTATSTNITVQESSSTTLTLTVAGAPLALTCTAYANNSVPSGLVTSTPSGNPIAPVIATAGSTVPPTTTVPVSSTTTLPSGSTTTTTTTPTTPVSGPYELYCPGTPVGNIALNGVQTVASLSPANPGAGDSFTVSGYQTTVNLPSAIASAAQALGNTAISGSASARLVASGATPSTLEAGPFDFNVPLPTPIPASGVTLSIPSPAADVGPFSATGTGITIAEGPISLTLLISGSNLNLTCDPYPNNAEASGMTSGSPPGSPSSPVIAASGSGPTPTTTSTTSTTSAPPTSSSTSTSAATTSTSGAARSTTTAATSGGSSTSAGVVTAPSSSLAFTGSGPGVGLLGVLGGALVVLGFALFMLVDAPRRLVGRLRVATVARRASSRAAAQSAKRSLRWLLGR
jgi:hypothetical protein